MIMNSGPECAEHFLSIENGLLFLLTKYMANDDFSEPPRRADPKIPFSFFADFGVRVTSGAQGSFSGGFRGSHQLSIFFWGVFWPQ